MSRRLFWKIFLPFWVAQALLLGALYLRVHYRISSEHPWWIQPERKQMPMLAALAAHEYEEQGAAGLRQLLDSMSLEHRSRYWLVNAAGQELSGGHVSDHLLQSALAAEKNDGLFHSYEANVLAARANTPSGQYLLIGELTPPPISERIPGDILWTLKLGT